MEDSVPTAEKINAREIIRTHLPPLAGKGSLVLPRVNSLDTQWVKDDLAAVVGPHIDGICIGKVDAVEDIARVEGRAQGERAGGEERGLQGQVRVHPAQIEPINESFSPSPEEVEQARRVVQAFEEAERQGRGSTSLEGQVIDVPVVKRARALLALAGRAASGVSRQQGTTSTKSAR